MSETDLLALLGENIRRIRLQKRLTQTELAGRCDFEKASMSRIESGQTNATILTLLKISEALNVHIIDFFED